MEFLRPVTQNPLFGLVSLLISVILAVVGIVLTVRSRRVKRLSWAIRSNNLISGFSTRFPSLEVSYARHKAENLTVSKILFWNDGTETISEIGRASCRERVYVLV